MKERLIDSNLILPSTENKPGISNWSSLVLLWIGIALCIYLGLIKETRVIVAIIGLVGASIATYINYELGVKITFGIICLGVMTLLTFYPINAGFSLNIGDFSIGFEVVMFCVLLIHYYTNKDTMSTFVSQFYHGTDEELKSEQRVHIDGFKRRFANSSISELKKKVNNPSLIPEAIKAAEELLEERGNGY